MKNKKFLSVSVLPRFMSEEEIAVFMEKYNATLKQGHNEKQVTDEDREVLKDFQSGMKPKDLGKKYNKSTNGIQTAILRAIRG